MQLDDIDSKVIQLLSAHGRMTWAELGAAVGLTAPAAADRARRLEERGILRGYAALIDPEAVGLPLTAFIYVTLSQPRHREPFLRKVRALGEVLECHHIAGDDDYLLKVVTATPRSLDTLLSETLKSLPGVARTRTTIALSTPKATVVLPVR